MQAKVQGTERGLKTSNLSEGSDEKKRWQNTLDLANSLLNSVQKNQPSVVWARFCRDVEQLRADATQIHNRLKEKPDPNAAPKGYTNRAFIDDADEEKKNAPAD